MQGTHDLKNIFRVHEYSRIAHYFGQRSGVRGHYGSAVGHRLQWWQPKAFVERGKDEDLSGVIKNAQSFNRHKAQKTNVFFDSAFYDGAAQVRVFGELVTDDDELEVGELVFFLQLRLERRECLNGAHHVFMWANSAGVEDEGIVHLVALRNELPVGVVGVSHAETIINGVGHHFNLL